METSKKTVFEAGSLVVITEAVVFSKVKYHGDWHLLPDYLGSFAFQPGTILMFLREQRYSPTDYRPLFLYGESYYIGSLHFVRALE